MYIYSYLLLVEDVLLPNENSFAVNNNNNNNNNNELECRPVCILTVYIVWEKLRPWNKHTSAKDKI